MYYIAWVSNRPRFRNDNNKKSLKIRLRHTEDDKICGSPVCITVRPRFDWSLIAKVTFDSPDSSNPPDSVERRVGRVENFPENQKPVKNVHFFDIDRQRLWRW